jgi:hypothetical protein
MKRAKIFAALIYGTLVLATMAFVHFPDLQADEAQPRIQVEQAREAALRAVPGTVREDDLETHHGRLVYSFEIAPAGRHGTFEIAFRQHGYFAGVPLHQRHLVEVNVSAMDGSIVNVHRKHEVRRDGAERAQITPQSAIHEGLL